MRNTLLLLFSFAFLLPGCKDEITLPEPDLHHDGPNQSAPFLPVGTHEAAARFPAAKTGVFAGQNLTAVDFFLQNVPVRCFVRIYGQGTEREPGALLHEQEVSGGVRGNSWNRYNLTTPIPLTGEDLWISIAVQHNGSLASIGCDPGPAVENGDWLAINTPGPWQTLRDYSKQGISINWNIRGFVSP